MMVYRSVMPKRSYVMDFMVEHTDFKVHDGISPLNCDEWFDGIADVFKDGFFLVANLHIISEL